VVTVGERLGMYGKISKELYRRNPDGLATRARNALRTLGVEKLMLGQATSIPVTPEDGVGATDRIILVAWWSHESPYTIPKVYAGIANAIREAFAHGVTTLACPVFNAPGLRIEPIITKVLRELSGLKNADRFSVEELKFVSQKAGNDALQKYFDENLYD